VKESHVVNVTFNSIIKHWLAQMLVTSDQGREVVAVGGD